jgi:cysteine-rich repeat protein
MGQMADRPSRIPSARMCKPLVPLASAAFLVAIAFETIYAAPPPEVTCEASKKTASAKYAAMLGACWSTALKSGGALAPSCRQRGATAFERALDRAEGAAVAAGSACPTSDDDSFVTSAIDQLTSTIAARIAASTGVKACRSDAMKVVTKFTNDLLRGAAKQTSSLVGEKYSSIAAKANAELEAGLAKVYANSRFCPRDAVPVRAADVVPLVESLSQSMAARLGGCESVGADEFQSLSVGMWKSTLTYATALGRTVITDAKVCPLAAFRAGQLPARFASALLPGPAGSDPLLLLATSNGDFAMLLGGDGSRVTKILTPEATLEISADGQVSTGPASVASAAPSISRAEAESECDSWRATLGVPCIVARLSQKLGEATAISCFKECVLDPGCWLRCLPLGLAEDLLFDKAFDRLCTVPKCAFDATCSASSRCGVFGGCVVTQRAKSNGRTCAASACDQDRLVSYACLGGQCAGRSERCGDRETCVANPEPMCSTSCGDHVQDPWEECDEGGPSPTCDDDCTVPACGDGRVNTAAGEECDDGGRAPNDGCDESCHFECGNGSLQPGEVCDPALSVGAPGTQCEATACTAVPGNLGRRRTCVCSPCNSNGTIDSSLESCDAPDFAEQSCESFGFDEGALGCADCQIDLAGCRCRSSFTAIGLPFDGAFSIVRDVSADGRVLVGKSDEIHPEGGELGEWAFRWTAAGGFDGIGGLGSFEATDAEAISGDGSTVVGMAGDLFQWDGNGDGVEEDICCISRAFKSGPGGAFLLPSGGGLYPQSRAYDVSASGDVVVGQVRLAPLTPFGDDPSIVVPARWIGGDLDLLSSSPGQALGISPNGDYIVGDVASPSGRQAFRWSADDGIVLLGELPGGDFLSAGTVVNNAGVVWGSSTSTLVPHGVGEPFRWSPSTGMVGLGVNMVLEDATPDGRILVGRRTSVGFAEALVWTPNRGVRSLKGEAESLCQLDLSGWQLQFAEAITPDGKTIVGFGIAPSGKMEGFRLRCPAIATGGQCTPE